ncbi:MAG: MetS family NSS transporter small subunit [Bacteroidetes bacterium]|nr:MetS family NSS transporter small subunit [Bacteroidota bacterium]
MSLLTIFMIVFITGIVWGGFIFFLIKAINKERQKAANG